jgi:PIN domain nuclease of toxin-antitoxin system
LKLLLDTHAALWWLTDDERMGAAAASHLDSAANQVLVSAAVVWEIAIKRSIGKLDASDDVVATLLAFGASPLPVSLEHAAAVATLPFHHRDPFDRLLIAQARIEGAALVSREEALRRYGVPVVW